MYLFTLLVLLCALFEHANGLYFLVGDVQKCFTLEQPRDTPMFFTYQIFDKDHELIFDLYYGSTPRPDMQIMHKILSDSRGHIDFTADNDGMFSYCLVQSSQYQKIPVKFSMSISYGFDSEHYEKLIKEHNFDSVNLQVHKLNDLLTMTLNEADFQKHKEVEYHEQTEMINNTALWWPVVQIAILIITGIYQVHHLKHFFKSNKFV